MGLFPFSLIPLVLYVLAAIVLYDHANYIVEPGEVALHPFWSRAAFDWQLVDASLALSGGSVADWERSMQAADLEGMASIGRRAARLRAWASFLRMPGRTT